MTNKMVPPRSAPTAAEAEETERMLFEGLARVKMFPMDPGRPGQPPSQMLPVSSFLRKETDQPEPLLASMTREFEERCNASGRTITVEEPPKGPQPLVATFHRAKRKPTKGKS
jgi:hypothetical protein